MKRYIAISLSCLLLFACNNKKPENHSESDKRFPDTSGQLKTPVSVNPLAPIDVSPMDMSYFPVDFPKLKNTNSSEQPMARVVYSRPHLQGRKLFNDILKYGEPWRLGANESTELDLYKDATIQGKKIAQGRYIMYCIPQKDKWTIVLNSNIDSWGLHPDPTKDLDRFVIPVKKTNDRLEYFTMVFRSSANDAELVMAWDDVEAVLPVSF